MSGRSGEVMSGVVNTVGSCVVSFLFATVAGGVSQPPPQSPVSTCSAATLALLYIPSHEMPSAAGSIRDRALDPRKPDATPMPAPAATNHYARSPEIRIQHLEDEHATNRRMLESLVAAEQKPDH